MNWLGRYTKFTAILLLALTTKFAMSKQVEIEDVLGRKVTIDTPAKRVLLGFYIEDYFAIGGEKSFDRLAGISSGWFLIGIGGGS